MKFQLFLILALAVLSHAATLKSYNVELEDVAVSGLSAGGFMAVQMHVAFSKQITGSAIFAGGPFFCAQGSLSTALTTCMSSPATLSVSNLSEKTASMAQAGHIDSTDNLKGSKVYVYSGEGDTVVNPGVVKGTASMFEQYGAEVTAEFNIDSEHCYPTIDFGNPCTKLGSPYISACNYSGASNSFNALYSNLKPAGTQNPSNLFEFDQSAYYNSSTNISFGPTGYVYVPTACQKNEKCRLHIAFHGCQQTIASIGTEFITKIGINEIAESNNLIVLYPQVEKSYYAPSNPDACFDWWGYTTPGELPVYNSPGYVYKSAPQMAAVWKMAQAIAGGNSSADDSFLPPVQQGAY